MNTSLSIDERHYQRVLDADLMDVFDRHRNAAVDPRYETRADRNRFAAAQLRSTQEAKRILNLGGGGARHLQASLASPDISVYEIDMQGDCDLSVNLDSLDRLPFEDSSFDVACAFDVLEHLEHFHLVNEEMFRVARNYILVALPNAAAEIPYDVLRNRPQRQQDPDRGTFSFFYGLPLQPPSDRHRWWLYFQDIVRFYHYFALHHDAKLEFWTPRLTFKKRAFATVFGSHLYHTFFCPYVWVKVGKRK
jgi:SAM-dependent methyltransferase